MSTRQKQLEPDRVLDHEPQPVKNESQFRIRDAVPGLVVCLALGVMCTAYILLKGPEPAKERATDTIPMYVYETCNSCEPYILETCPDCTWLSRFVGALDAQAESPLEIKNVLHRAYVESRFDDQAVSDTGDWGICQINAKTHPGVIVQRLLSDPEYAAFQCLKTYRAAYKACGKRWECCYRYGVKGCKRGMGY